jgi:hypothetical protein
MCVCVTHVALHPAGHKHPHSPTLLPCPTGVFTSSWIGAAFLGLGEWIIRKLPIVKHIYSAAKQVSQVRGGRWVGGKGEGAAW